MKVFIGWSGATGRAFGQLLHGWLPKVLQAVEPFFSPEDIGKGTRWSSAITSALDTSQAGIIVVTQESRAAPWILFEAGALSKIKVVPILVDLELADVPEPLRQFQCASVTALDIKRVLTMLNGEMDHPLPPEVFESTFTMWWPTLEKQAAQSSGHADSKSPTEPSIHLDTETSNHTVDLAFKQFHLPGDILILQTWIPERRPQTEGPNTPTRIEQWGTYLKGAFDAAPRDCPSEMQVRVLLVGSTDVLRNRIRYRMDLAKAQGVPCPFRDRDIDKAVEEGIRRVNNTADELLLLEKNVSDHVAKTRPGASLKVRIRFYHITPAGPIYVFGSQELIAGFYDPRWTSDAAPAIRLDNPHSAEWAYFTALFKCVWSLRGDPSGSPGGPGSVWTEHHPDWQWVPPTLNRVG